MADHREDLQLKEVEQRHEQEDLEAQQQEDLRRKRKLEELQLEEVQQRLKQAGLRLTKEELQLEEAKQRLEEAKQRLKHEDLEVKQRLEEAKQRLKHEDLEAKQRLEREEVELRLKEVELRLKEVELRLKEVELRLKKEELQLVGAKQRPEHEDLEAKKEAAKQRKLKELPTPSDLANVKTWLRVQTAAMPQFFFCFRPESNDRVALPVALLDATLDELVGLFADAMGGRGEPLSQQDCWLAFRMCEAMADGFTDERERETAFTDLLAAYIGFPIKKDHPNTSSNAETDGTILYHVPCQDRMLSLPVYIQEVKPEIGSSDPYFQGQRYYQLYLTDESSAAALSRTVLPVLFVELVGPHVRVSALASAEGAIVVCEPLTPFLHLFTMLNSQRHHMDRLARVFRALKQGVQRLLKQAAEATLATAPQPTDPAAAGREPYLRLPYLLRPGSGFENVRLLKPNSQLLYEADYAGKRVVVKFTFTQQHAVDVHEGWAAAGLAPVVFKRVSLACGLTMLVMELLGRGDNWIVFYDLDLEAKQLLCPAVREKLARAHDTIIVHGQKTVHADLRQANVMVKQEQDGELCEVRFLDFDWSGLVGKTLLPSFMRERVEGFGAGRQATQAYDLALWDHEMRDPE
ncbi:Reticulocyte-binding protein 2 a [Tetrabaena socialis]|uniref:Reticulocyte-binding protein 2 a n=1 Tax=Tetrabaena socialis TaxID=47790 RepID=A0A2J8AIB0_9CHLO|nr:Reticulocyte-binding protein 2 a [Tetrabaena socialis]|eukprot:PNH12251.1 Reticulocyte-binding protein 2 a [Tetrabaena socialis]